MGNADTDAAHARADWRRVEQLYGQLSAIADDPEKQNVPPNLLTGGLAESMSRLFAHYDGIEHQFMDDVFATWSEVEQLPGNARERFQRLYYNSRFDRFAEYNPPGEGRRRPKPFETAIETCRRLIDVNGLRDALAPMGTTGILGGSVSYGRFFNVSGAARAGKASDADLLLVVADYGTLEDVAKQLRRVKGLDQDSLDQFKKRIGYFTEIRTAKTPCIFSHKLRFWDDKPDPYLDQYRLPGQYFLSMHVFSRADFEYMILKDQPILEADSDGKFTRTIYDYRDSEPTRFDNQRSFSGIDYTIDLKKEQVLGGFVSQVSVCHIADQRYYPGLHQNLILPQFEIRWEAPTLLLYLPVIGFRWKVLERLQEERRLRPFEIQRLSLCHTRSAIFSPHIVQRCDRE